MKIAVDIRSLGDKNLTGVGTYVLGMLTGLTQAELKPDDDITLWYSGGAHVRDRIRQRITRFPFFRLEIPIPNKILKLGMLFPVSMLSGRLSGFDYHWLPNIDFFQTSEVPYTVTVHDLSFLHNPLYYSYKHRLSHRLIFSQKLLERAHLIIAVSNATKEDIIRFFPSIPSERMVVVPPGLPSMDSDHLDTFPQLPERYILFVGTIEPRKNIHALLDAFDIVSTTDTSLHLVLAGGGGWSNDSIIRRFRNNEKIHWLGFVTPSQKEQLYKNALAFVWPSFYEGYGFPPLEALRHGTPVITSYRTSLPEILNSRAYYVNPYNPSELALVISSVLAKPRMTQTTGTVSTYAWRDAALKFIDTIHQNV